MNAYNIVAQSTESTVVTEYKPQEKRSEAYQSEADAGTGVHRIRYCTKQGYEYLAYPRRKGADMPTLRTTAGAAEPAITFSDNEWEQFFHRMYRRKKRRHCRENTGAFRTTISESCTGDNGSSEKHLSAGQEEHPQQPAYRSLTSMPLTDGTRDNRYDVTVLVNGSAAGTY